MVHKATRPVCGCGTHGRHPLDSKSENLRAGIEETYELMRVGSDGEVERNASIPGIDVPIVQFVGVR